MPQMHSDFDAQDSAEVFEETNMTKDGQRMANFDTSPDVFDATSAEDDDDLDDEDLEIDEADFDEDEVDGDVLETARDDEGLRRALAPANDIDTDDDQPDDYQASSGDPGDGGDDTPPQEVPDDGDHTPEEQPMEADEHVDKQLDKGLKETFPASDPVSINPGAD